MSPTTSAIIAAVVTLLTTGSLATLVVGRWFDRKTTNEAARREETEQAREYLWNELVALRTQVQEKNKELASSRESEIAALRANAAIAGERDALKERLAAKDATIAGLLADLERKE